METKRNFEDRAISQQRERLWAAALIVIILLLGAALLWCNLDARDVRGKDENASIIKLDQPNMRVVLKASGMKANGQPSPMQPLYFLVQHLFWPVVRRSAFVLRFLPSVFGILAIALTYKLGEVLWNRAAGLAGALLVAVLPLQIEYGQTIRPYALLTMLSLASLYLLVRALRTNKPIDWAGFAMMATLNVYNHFNAFFVLAIEGLFTAVVWLVALIATLKERQGQGSGPRQLTWLAGPVIGFLAVGILCLPAFIRFMRLDMVGGEGEVAVEFAAPFFSHFLYNIGLTTAWLRGLILGLMFLGLVATLFYRRWQAALLAVLWLAVPFTILAVLIVRPFAERYVIFVPPVALLLAGQGVATVGQSLGVLGRRWLGRDGERAITITIAAGLALFFLSPLHTYYATIRTPSRMEQMLAVVEQHARPGDVVIVSPRFFVRPLAVDGATVLYLTKHPTPAEMDDLTAHYQRMWILYSSYIVPVELREPLDRWVQAQQDGLVRVRIKASTALAYGNRALADPEANLKDRIAFLEDIVQIPGDEKETSLRYNTLADVYQSLSDLHTSRGELALAAEYQRKADEARAAAPLP